MRKPQCVYYNYNCNTIIIDGSVKKLKILSDVHSILLGAVENNFQLVIQKNATKVRVTFKTFRRKKSAFIGKLDF